MIRGHLRFDALRSLVALLFVTGASLSIGHMAFAASAPIHISGTDGIGVNIRPTPDTSQPALGRIPEGASPDYNCYKYGQAVGGVSVWFSVNYGGRTGYYASFYDDSSYRTEAELESKYYVPKCGVAAPAPTVTPAPAPPPSVRGSSPSHVYSIMNADIGVYYRRSPHWSDTARTSGVGVYNGDRVEIICGAQGDPVGPYQNTAWSYVRNQTRPSIGAGWVSERFINDGAGRSAWPSGIPTCDSTTAASTPNPSQPSTSPQPVQATGLVYPVVDAGGGVYYRRSPHWSDTARTSGVGVYNGNRVRLICGAWGEAVGPYANRWWSYVENQDRPSIGRGWVNHHFIGDGLAANRIPSGEPTCSGAGTSGDTTLTVPASGSIPGLIRLGDLDRDATRRWAQKHAQDRPPYRAACTWFISQALWEGRLLKTPAWTSVGGHGIPRISWRPGSPAAWATPLFVKYIRSAYPRSTYRQLKFSPTTNAIPDAQIGDVIVYDWYGKSSVTNVDNLTHASLIVRLAPGGPFVAEWGVNDPNATPYSERFWTWSEQHKMWLVNEKDYHRAQAFLLHIDTRR